MNAVEPGSVITRYERVAGGYTDDNVGPGREVSLGAEADEEPVLGNSRMYT
jgi:hypothetical protein